VSLHRFLEAQDPVMDAVMAELAAGAKRTHWMWFVFPQLATLGRSATARFYGLGGLEDARAYLAHPVLGERLRGCVRAVLAHRGKSAHAIFGSPDDLKFRSCMTLFALADPDEPLFAQALAAFYHGNSDPATLALVGEAGAGRSPARPGDQ